ncbi:MAG: DNA-3-methyladenine glycosylase I [Chromatiales bacterium]
MNDKNERKRCGWVSGGNDLYLAYHDEEWGVPVRDDRTQFEFLILEGAQAGLSWATVLNKRAAYRKAFAQFDPEKVARFSDRKIARLLDDPGIIRNRLKVNAAVSNARAFLDVRQEFDGFCNYIWSFVGNSPIQNRWKRMDQVPATSKESDALARDLRQRGFKFVGSTIVYAHMQATGMVNDHVTDCFRHSECRDLALVSEFSGRE